MPAIRIKGEIEMTRMEHAKLSLWGKLLGK
jgi:hypothetical protein